MTDQPFSDRLDMELQKNIDNLQELIDFFENRPNLANSKQLQCLKEAQKQFKNALAATQRNPQVVEQEWAAWRQANATLRTRIY